MTNFTNVSRRLAALVVSIGVLGGAAVNAGELHGDRRSQQVTLGDIDLSTAEGVRLAQVRLNKIARTLCAKVSDELDLSHHDNFVKCVASATAQTEARLQVLLNRLPIPALAQADRQ